MKRGKESGMGGFDHDVVVGAAEYQALPLRDWRSPGYFRGEEISSEGVGTRRAPLAR